MKSLIAVTDDKEYPFRIRQATKLGYALLRNGGVADLTYPGSKTRRGRVQGDGGDIAPTLTTSCSLYVIELEENDGT